MRLIGPLALLALAQLAQTAATPIPVDGSATGASEPVRGPFVSFSVELAFWPDFAGNISAPNSFSNTLLDNLADLTGTKPYVRVGGNTQDFALYKASLEQATYGIIDPAVSPDYPSTLFIGPSFFESYLTFPGVRYIHGFNLGKNDSDSRDLLLQSIPLACNALSDGRLLYWELGNEPDMYDRDWNEAGYVQSWLSVSEDIHAAMSEACPDLAGSDAYKYIAPSFAGLGTTLDPIKTWAEGLNTNGDIAEISSHNYIDDADNPEVTLQATLMNHSRTVESANEQINQMIALDGYGLPFILGEYNSLFHQGAPGLSDSFGAALWGVDFNLYIASQNITSGFMHQGTDYRYASWQPVDTEKAPKSTKPPYYGNIAVASMLGDMSAGDVRIRHLELSKETEAAYAAYVDDILQRVLVINMEGFNYSTPAMFGNASRPEAIYSFSVPASCAGDSIVTRLIANGSDAVTGISWNGFTYNWDINEGNPSRLDNVTTDEPLTVGEDGVFSVSLSHSSAAMVQLTCSDDGSI